jgi:hypothetical protein
MRSALVLVLVAGAAHAEPKYDDNDFYPRLTAGGGIGFHNGDLADLTANGGNLSLQFGVKVRPAVFVDGLFDFSSGTATGEMLAKDLRVQTKAVGLAVRNPLMSFGDEPHGLGGDMFATIGVGREWIEWEDGGLARNTLMLGMGVTMNLPSAKEVFHHLRFGFRMLFARAPTPAKRPVACDGPCDTATATEPYDFAMVVEVTCHLGR